MQRHEAVVVGAGHAGLAVSQRLAAAGVEHLVLERGRIAETWRSQRWDTFRLNTPSWVNRMPGVADADVPQPADAFQDAPGFAARLAAYAERWRLPVREGTAVTAVRPDGGDLVVEVGGRGGGRLRAGSVVVASGIQNRPRIPGVAAALPAWVTQLPALDYRNPGSLPGGSVLVVGGGQTGGQIVDDLLDAGREVYWSPSRVGRIRRRHRGREVLEWLIPSGFYDVPLEQLPDPAMQYARQPLISGVGRYGHTLSLQWLAARGASLVGRIRSVHGHDLQLDDVLAACIRFGDEASVSFRGITDEKILATGLALPPLEDDPADEPHPDPDAVRSPERLNLRARGIRTVIWATGVGGDFSWLPKRVLDADGAPIHEAGVTRLPGLFVLGFPWLTNRGSGIIYGISGDAARIADRVTARVG